MEVPSSNNSSDLTVEKRLLPNSANNNHTEEKLKNERPQKIHSKAIGILKTLGLALIGIAAVIVVGACLLLVGVALKFAAAISCIALTILGAIFLRSKKSVNDPLSKESSLNTPPQSPIKENSSAPNPSNPLSINSPSSNSSSPPISTTPATPSTQPLNPPSKSFRHSKALEYQIPDPSNFNSPMEWIDACGGKEGIDRIQDQLIAQGIPFLENAAHRFLEQQLKKGALDLRAFEEFAVELKKMSYLRELLNVKQALIEKIGERETQEVLLKWQMSSTADERNSIIKTALEHVPQEIQFKHALDKIEKGALVEAGCQEAAILEKFPVLKQQLKDENQAKIYRSTINKTLIRQMLVTAGVFDGSSFESKIIHKMGYDDQNYLDHEKIHKTMNVLLKTMLNDKTCLHSKSLQDLRIEIKEKAFEQRLKFANVETVNFPLVKQTMQKGLELNRFVSNALNGFSIEWVDQKDLHIEANQKQGEREAKYAEEDAKSVANPRSNKKECRPQLILDHPQHLGITINQQTPVVKWLNDVVYLEKNKIKSGVLNGFINKCKPLKGIEGCSKSIEEAFVKSQELVKKRLSEESFREKFQNKVLQNKRMEWFNKYGSDLSVELIQGLDDEQEVFTEGCCFAIVHRIIGTILQNPKAEDHELNAGKVLPEDRFVQAKYNTLKKRSAKENDAANYMPVKKSKHNGSNALWGFYDSFEEELLSRLPLPQQSCGIIRLGLFFNSGGGHDTFVQIDTKNNIYRIFDPNIGLIRFNPEPHLNQKQMAQKVTKGYLDLLDVLYGKNDIKIIFGTAHT